MNVGKRASQQRSEHELHRTATNVACNFQGYLFLVEWTSKRKTTILGGGPQNDIHDQSVHDRESQKKKQAEVPERRTAEHRLRSDTTKKFEASSHPKWDREPSLVLVIQKSTPPQSGWFSLWFHFTTQKYTNSKPVVHGYVFVGFDNPHM